MIFVALTDRPRLAAQSQPSGSVGSAVLPPRPTGRSARGSAMAAFHTMAAGCGGVVHRGLIGPTGCEAEPAFAGLWYASHGRTAWLGFACDRQVDQLIAPRPLLPRDRDVLERRRERHRTEMGGKRWAGEQEGPIARGAAAERLIERARAWTAGHPS